MMTIPVVVALGGSRSNGWRLKMLENASRSMVQSRKQVMNVLVDFIMLDPIKDSPEICNNEADVFSVSTNSDAFSVLYYGSVLLVET